MIELLDKNAETVDFVADYEKKKDKPYADTIEEDLSNGEIRNFYNGMNAGDMHRMERGS